MDVITKVIKEKLGNEVSDQFVLDVGTGSAIMALTLAKLGMRCITIDKSESAKKVALNKIENYDGKLKPLFMKMNACSMDFIDDTFDAVVAYKSLHHIEQSLVALEEMYRVCKPKGKIIIIEHNMQNRQVIDFMNSLKSIEHPKEIDLNTLEKTLTNYSGDCERYNTEIGEIFILTKRGEKLEINDAAVKDKKIELGKYKHYCFYYDVDKKRLIKENLDEGQVEEIFSSIDKIPKVTPSLCLNMANMCNFGCQYCYAEGGNYSHEECIMPYHIAMESLDWYTQYVKEKYHIIFFGGEPLLNKKVINDILRDNKKETTYSINTNGSLLDEEFVKNMCNHNGKISLSIDGKEEVHDKLRVYKDGKATYQDALRTFHGMSSDKKARIWARMTITNEMDDIFENVKHVIDLGFRRIDISFVAGNYALSERENQIEQWKKSLDALASFCLKAWLEDDILIYPFVKVYQSAILGLKSMDTCTAGRELLSIQPDGTIVPCFKYSDIKVGDIKTGVDENKLSEFESFKQIQRMLVCNGCWAFNICGGLCSKDTNVVIKIKPIRCGLTQYLVLRCLYYLCVQNEEDPQIIKKITYKQQMSLMIRNMKIKGKIHDS